MSDVVTMRDDLFFGFQKMNIFVIEIMEAITYFSVPSCNSNTISGVTFKL